MSRDPLVDLRACARHLKGRKEFAFDLETTGLNPREDRIRGVAIGTDKRQWYFHTIGNASIPLRMVKEELSPVLLDVEKLCVLHNAKFDLQFMASNNWMISNRLADTMILAFYLDDNRSGTGRLTLKGKGGLVDELFDVILETWEESELSGGLFGKSEDLYAKQDAEYTMKCWKKLSRQLSSYPEIKKFFWEVGMPMVKILADMESAGMKADTDYLEEYERVVMREAAEIEAHIIEAVGKPIKVGSPEQLSRYLFADVEGPKLEPKPWMKPGKKGLYSTAESVLSLYSQQSPIAQMVLDWRAKNKLVSTYISPFLSLARANTENRIYCSLLQCGTKTGRLASRSPNLQNIPRYTGGEWGMRKAFVAPKGKKLIVADYCLAEGTKVPTSVGMKSVENVVPGDLVIQECGSLREVLRTADSGAQKCYELMLDKGYSVVATAEHRFRIIDKKGEYIWKRLGDLSVGDSVALASGFLRGEEVSLPEIHFTHHNNNKEVSAPLVSSEMLAQYCGYLTGDGTFSDRYFGWVVNSKDPDVDRMLRRLTDGLFRAKSAKSCYRGVVEGKVSSKPVASWLRDLGVSKETIPQFVWFGGKVIAGCWLSGLFESDGCVTLGRDGRVSVASSRRGLMEGVQDLLLSLGIPSALRRQRQSLKGTDGRSLYLWEVSVTSVGLDRFSHLVGFLSQRKRRLLSSLIESEAKRNPKVGGLPNQKERVRALRLRGEIRKILNNTAVRNTPITPSIAEKVYQIDPAVYRRLGLDKLGDGMVFLPVKRITDVGEQRTFDLEVAGSKTFLANGFVSHNSQLELRLMAHRSQDKSMLEIYRTGGDIHQNTQDALGLGKQDRTVAKNCVVEGTEILTEKGMIPIEELVTHREKGWREAPELRIQSYDKLRKIEKVYYGGEQTCYRVNTEYGLCVDQTGDHEVPVIREEEITLVRTDKLKKGDLMIMKIGADVHGKEVRIHTPEVVGRTSYKGAGLPKKVTRDVAAFLGYFVSEGRAEPYGSGRYQVSFGFGSEEVEMFRRVLRTSRGVLGDRVHTYSRSDGALVVYVTSKQLHTWLGVEGAGCSSGEKEIPRCVRRAPWELKREFFRAYFDGDGTVKSSAVSATSKSEKLIRQIQAEMFNVGIVGRIHRDHVKGYGCYWSWVTNDIATFQKKVGFGLSKKNAAANKVKNKQKRALLFLDGFERQLDAMRPLLKYLDKNKITECITHKIRFGETRLTDKVKGLLKGDAAFMVQNGLWTARVRRVKKLQRKRKVYDLYEPVHKVMLVSPLVTGDCNFGLIYGLSAQGLKDTLWNNARLAKTLEECQQWRYDFFRAYPGIVRYHERIERFLKKHGYTRTLAGRRRRVKEDMARDPGYAFRMALNSTIQGSAADIVMIAMRNFHNSIEKMRRLGGTLWHEVRMLLQVHDEIIVETPEEIAEEVRAVLKEDMEGATTLSIPLIAEPGIGDSWAEAK